MKNYEIEFNKFWHKIVCNKDGTLNEDSVKRELYDYTHLMGRMTVFIDYATGGMASKPNTDLEILKTLVDEHVEKLYGEE